MIRMRKPFKQINNQQDKIDQNIYRINDDSILISKYNIYSFLIFKNKN